MTRPTSKPAGSPNAAPVATLAAFRQLTQSQLAAQAEAAALLARAARALESDRERFAAAISDESHKAVALYLDQHARLGMSPGPCAIAKQAMERAYRKMLKEKL